MVALRQSGYGRRILLVFCIIILSSAGSLVFGAPGFKAFARKIARGAKKLENRKIAVLSFPHHDGQMSPGSTIVSERLTTYLGDYKTISVIERTLLDKVMSEHKLAKTGIVDQETTKELGKILGVEAIVTGTLINLENKKTEVNARMIHTETGRVLSTGLITIKRTWADKDAPAPQQPPARQTSYQAQARPGQLTDEQFEFVLKFGGDFQGKEGWSGTRYYTNFWGNRTSEAISESYDVKNGISLSAEMIFYLNQQFGLGFGLTFQMPRELADFNSEFYYTPIYGMGKLKLSPGPVSPYIIGQGGYNFLTGDADYTLNGDIEGGAYAGGGAGVQFQNGFLVELLYSINWGYLEFSNSAGSYEIYLTYRKLRLAAGYAF